MALLPLLQCSCLPETAGDVAHEIIQRMRDTHFMDHNLTYNSLSDTAEVPLACSKSEHVGRYTYTFTIRRSTRMFLAFLMWSLYCLFALNIAVL